MFILYLIVFSGFCHAQENTNIATGFFEGEPYLAINPTNNKNIVIAWMHITQTSRPIRTRASFDGGVTWENPVDLPVVNTNTADPTMAFDNAGKLHLCFIDHLGTSTGTNVGGVYSYISSDGGLSWSNQVKVIDINADGAYQPIDRPWLVYDKSNGPNAGNLYLTTKTVSGGPTPDHPYFMKSSDGGLSWSPWRYVDTTGWLSGVPSIMAAPTVSANGTFTSIYPSYVPAQNPFPQYIMAYSEDGGNSFQYKSGISYIPTVSNDSAKRGYQFISNPINSDHLALLYLAGDSGDFDIFMAETFDFGDNWSNGIRINDDSIGNGALQDLVWASFDADGDVVVCWRDRRNGAGVGYATSSQIFGAVRWKDSLNFSANFLVSDTLTPYNNILAEAGNDFLCQQMLDDTLYITWGDTRTGFLNIWFDKIALSSGVSTGLTSVNHSAFPILEVFPNPSDKLVFIDVDDKDLVSIQLYDLNGKLLKTVDQNSFSIEELSNGEYFIVTQTADDRFFNKLVKK